MDKKAAIVAIIIGIAEEFNQDHPESQIDLTQGKEASLYARDGVLDSVGLVSFVVAVEQGLEDKLGLSLVLADEKALSQQKSPFRSIGSLADYAADLAREEA